MQKGTSLNGLAVCDARRVKKLQIFHNVSDNNYSTTNTHHWRSAIQVCLWTIVRRGARGRGAIFEAAICCREVVCCAPLKLLGGTSPGKDCHCWIGAASRPIARCQFCFQRLNAHSQCYLVRFKKLCCDLKSTTGVLREPLEFCFSFSRIIIARNLEV